MGTRGMTAFVGLAVLCVAAAGHAQTVVHINPRSAYIRTNNDASLDAAPTALATLSVIPGQRLRIRAVGEYGYNSSGNSTNATGAVFSSSSTILASTELHRIPGAIDAGEDWISGPSFFGSVTTDIPEDFRVALLNGPNGVVVRIPPGAAYVFAAPVDSLFQDNSDADLNFGVEFTRVLCDADLDDGSGNGTPDNGVTIEDLLYFLSAFEAGAAAADLDNDGDPAIGTPDGAVTIDDLLFFLAHFEAGC